jgi:hypothetical protein
LKGGEQQMIGTYYRLSLADEDVGADKAESNSIQGQRGLVEGYIMARPELAAEPRQEWTMAIPAPLQAALRSSS